MVPEEADLALEVAERLVGPIGQGKTTLMVQMAVDFALSLARGSGSRSAEPDVSLRHCASIKEVSPSGRLVRETDISNAQWRVEAFRSARLPNPFLPADTGSLIILILILLVRPQGLLGRRERVG